MWRIRGGRATPPGWCPAAARRRALTCRAESNSESCSPPEGAGAKGDAEPDSGARAGCANTACNTTATRAANTGVYAASSAVAKPQKTPKLICGPQAAWGCDPSQRAERARISPKEARRRCAFGREPPCMQASYRASTYGRVSGHSAQSSDDAGFSTAQSMPAAWQASTHLKVKRASSLAARRRGPCRGS